MKGLCEVEKCFNKCGDKDVKKSDKLVECQTECVATAVVNGRARSSVGPTGMYRNLSFLDSFARSLIHLTQNRILLVGAGDLLICGSDCADKAEKEYKVSLSILYCLIRTPP